jgi:hypothetical protein
MPTDHQITEHRPPRSERQSGIIVTALIVIVVLGAAIWMLIR